MTIKLKLWLCILIFYLLVFKKAYCQQSDLKKAEFLANLRLKNIENKDSIEQIKQKIAAISRSDNWNKNKIYFGFLKRWKLVYSLQTGYHESFPNQYKDTAGFLGFKRLGTTSYLTPCNKTIVLAGFKLIRIFGVEKRMNYYPEIYARDARFNGQWTAISLSSDNLIIRYVSSYPDGNQTSWYHEEVYYFKRKGCRAK